jgi:hypothetical protein
VQDLNPLEVGLPTDLVEVNGSPAFRPAHLIIKIGPYVRSTRWGAERHGVERGKTAPIQSCSNITASGLIGQGTCVGILKGDLSRGYFALCTRGRSLPSFLIESAALLSSPKLNSNWIIQLYFCLHSWIQTRSFSFTFVSKVVFQLDH